MAIRNKLHPKHVITVLLSLFIVLTVWKIIQLKLHRTTPYFLGYKPVIMMTDTMAPAIKQYDTAIVKRDPSELQEGDMIYFTLNYQNYSIERIVETKPHGYVTKPDYASIPSLPFILKEDDPSKVIAILPTRFLFQDWLWILVIISITLLVIARLIYKYNKNKNKEMTESHDDIP